MKIVHISTSINGGAGKAAYRLHEALLKKKFDSTFIYLDNVKKKDINLLAVKEFKPNLIHKILNKIGFPIVNSHKNYNNYKDKNGEYEILTFPETDYRLENLDILKSADIIHLHWVANFINYPTFFKRLRDKKIFWTLHDMNPLLGIFHYKNDVIRNCINFEILENKAKIIKHSEILSHPKIKFICLCHWMSETLLNTPLLGKIKQIVIPNILDKNEFKSTEKHIAKKELNLNSQKTTLLFIADKIANYRKGFDILLGALNKIKNKNDYQLIVVGKTEALTNTGIETKCYNYVSSVDDLSLIYSASDVLIIPSREDNLPNTMVEALLCGTPVIGFQIGGLKDYIIPQFSGLLSLECSENSLLETINLFNRTKESYNQKEIRNFAIENFDLNKNLNRYIEVYKD